MQTASAPPIFSINRCFLHQSLFVIMVYFPTQFPFPNVPSQAPGAVSGTQMTHCLKMLSSSLDLYTSCSLSGMSSISYTLSTTLFSRALLISTLSFKILLGHQFFRESLPVLLFLALLVGTMSNKVKDNNKITTTLAAIINYFYVPGTVSCLYMSCLI